ncbi:hypothetical protein GJ744_002874 [Endocarpon pusillum]|uniref:Altered inheritance of mitochondria protein 41 n=1 Tax=Endocarpon pusillum TaxID=364733 RepID=A0A8H7A7G0_9EURO|nr:hypothetical protein GJ744_002874 [Endocarpon pusillum]
MLRCVRQPKWLALRGIRHTSTTSEPAPPLLAKIRNDLKTAMRAKDKSRLNVLRAILSDATNASKGPSPIKTDVQVLALLRKRLAGSKAASEEFAQAKRDDLKAKQDEEIAVMDEYAGQVETVAEEDIARAVEQAYQTLKDSAKLNAGMMLKELLRPGGLLNGKAVDGSRVAKMVQEILQTKT